MAPIAYSRWMRRALLGLLLGGCLIVRTHDEITEGPCEPSTQPQLVADAGGPFVLADAIYFIGINGTLSRVAFDGGVVSELTTTPLSSNMLAADATHLYFENDDAILRKPLAGGPSYAIAERYDLIHALAVDDASVVWASRQALVRWTKSDESITRLDTPSLVRGLGAYDGVYYYSDAFGERVRKAPPLVDLAAAQLPGPLFVDEHGVYFSESGAGEYTGSIRLVPRDGGTAVTTVKNLARTAALTADEHSLYFVTSYAPEYRVKQVSRFGGQVRTLACGRYEHHSFYLSLAPDFLYYADGRALYRIDKRELPL
jgi:hypothetical protein